MGVILAWKLFERHNKPVLARLTLSRREKAAVAPPGGSLDLRSLHSCWARNTFRNILCWRRFAGLLYWGLQHHCKDLWGFIWAGSLLTPTKSKFQGLPFINFAKVRHCLSKGDTDVQKFMHLFLPGLITAIHSYWAFQTNCEILCSLFIAPLREPVPCPSFSRLFCLWTHHCALYKLSLAQVLQTGSTPGDCITGFYLSGRLD